MWLGRRVAQMLAGRLPAGIPASWPAPPARGKSWGISAASPGLPGGARTPSRTSCPRPVPGGGDGPAHKAVSCPSLAGLAADAAFTPAAVTRYGKAAAIGAAAITCL